jgi:hypothetical protein
LRLLGRGEQGAIIVQVASSMLVLIGLSTFVVDFGILWTSRVQAQAAADAGAVAGAIARIYDDLQDPPGSYSGVVGLSAIQVATANPIWFAPGSPVVTFQCPLGMVSRCVRVDVYRDGTFGSEALPMIFGPVLGLTTQGVRATATAEVAVGNAVPCLKPFAIPDKWDDLRPVPTSWSPDDVFEKYAPGGLPLLPADEYVAPDGAGSGTGLTFAGELGLLVTLTFSDPTANDPLMPGVLFPLSLPGSKTFEQNIAGCNGVEVKLRQLVQSDDSSALAPTTAGLTDLIGRDPAASWDPVTRNVQNSCAPVCAPISPRLIAIGVFDVGQFQYMRAADDWALCGNESVIGRCVTLVNMVGFFLEDVLGSQVTGFLARHPGLLSPSDPTVVRASSFLGAATLVR